jgi:hypothetical protein
MRNITRNDNTDRYCDSVSYILEIRGWNIGYSTFGYSELTASLKELQINNYKKKKTKWPESASGLYRPRDNRLSAKLVSTIADRGVSRSQRGGSLRP